MILAYFFPAGCITANFKTTSFCNLKITNPFAIYKFKLLCNLQILNSFAVYKFKPCGNLQIPNPFEI